MARTTKLDDLVSKRICDALKAGHSFAGAARAAGIDASTLHDWRRWGKDGREPYAAFANRVDDARHVAENRCIEVLKKALESADQRLAADTAWKWLQRQRPLEWAEAKPIESELGSEDSSDLDVETLRAALSAAESRKVGT